MSYFREIPDIEYLSFLTDRQNSDEYVRAKNIFRRAKLREDIANPLLVFDKYQIPDGYRPDNVAEELYGSPQYDWVVLITAGIINVRDEWPISDNDVYRYSYEKYGDELYGVHHYITNEQKDSEGRVILDAGKVASKILQIPQPSYEGEINPVLFFSYPNIGVIEEQNIVKGNLYIHNISTFSEDLKYGNVIIEESSEVGYGGTWTYQLDISKLQDLSFTNDVASVNDKIEYIAIDGYLKTFTINIVVDKTNPGITTTINVNINSNEISYMTYFDDSKNDYITNTNLLAAITNYTHEINLNNEKRSIYVLKPRYLQEFLRDTRSIMRYKKSSQLVDDENGNDIIRTENTRTNIVYGSNFKRPSPTEIIVNRLA
jgi:hypothetical protein